MKSLLELYQLLLADITKPDVNKFYVYLCNYIANLDVCPSEIEILMEHFKTQFPSPTKHVAFYEHELFSARNVIRVNNHAWFNNVKNAELAYSLRVQLLTNIIAELKDGSN